MAVVLALALAGCVASAQVTSPSAGQSASAFGGVELTTPYALPDLTLTDDAGNDFNVRTGSDAPVLVWTQGTSIGVLKADFETLVRQQG